MNLEKKIEKAIQHHINGALEKAEKLYDDLLKISPNHVDLLHMRGILARQKNKYLLAEKLISEAIEKFPKNAIFYCSMGDIFKDQSKMQEAIEWYKKSLEIEPKHGEAYIRLAEMYHVIGDLKRTITNYEKGLALKARDDLSCFNLGIALQKQGQFELAVKWYKEAIGLNPGFADAYNNMGNSYQTLGNYHDAMESYHHALKINPDHYRAMNNMGKTLQDQGLIDKAVLYYDQAIKLMPDYADARFNRSIALLQQGNLKKGFREYEWRFNRSKSETIYPHHLKITRWEGQSYKEKTLFIHAEQGFGDTIHFIRYLPMVKSMGGRIIFETLNPLKGILQNFKCIDVLTVLDPERKKYPSYDYFIPLMSIPAIFKTSMETIPAEIPYLFADPKKIHYWKSRMVDQRFKIGLVWSGKISHEDDNNRSCRLKLFISLLKRQDVVFYSLQTDVVEKWTDPLPENVQIENIGEGFKDFSDTAGAIHNLDLIITVDTATAHLAGAMGKKVWLLLSNNPDWRWQLNRTDSPWYPTIKLFRQSKKGNWEFVIENVINELDQLLMKQNGKYDFKNKNHNWIEEKITAGIKFLQGGELNSAKRNFEMVLELEPKHSETLHLMGSLYSRKKEYQKAKKSIKKAIEINPKEAIYHLSIADLLKEEKKLYEAIKKYQTAIILNPNLLEAYYNMANTQMDIGNTNEALSSYQKAVKINPVFYQAYFNMGKVLQDLKKEDEAVKAYQKVIEIKPEMFEAYYNLGLIFQRKKELSQAIKYYNLSLKIKPDFSDAHNNLGSVFQEQNRFEKAKECYQNAVRCNPNYADGYYNIGKLYQDFHKFDEAISEYQKTIHVDSTHCKAFCNMGRAFHNLGRFEDAIACYEKALHLKDNYVEAHFNLSLTHLITGNFKEGWKEFEWRLKREEWRKTYPHRHHVPQWDGSEFKGKTLLVHCEQGVGDSINFVRYLPMVKKMGGQVIFESRKSLINLLIDFPGIDNLIELSPDRITQMKYDMFIPLMSLPCLFKTEKETIPSRVPYIKADKGRINQWKNRVKSNHLNIGLVWAGSGVYPSRSCPLIHLSMLAQVKDINFYGLQKGPQSLQLRDERIPQDFIKENFGEEFKDFSDTAAAIHHMDLIISIDTSVAHLAGAMGKPVWLMLPFVGDWRWLFDTEESIWYPGMKFFRQKIAGDWESVCLKMINKLEKWVKQHRYLNKGKIALNDSSLEKRSFKEEKKINRKIFSEDIDQAEKHYLLSMESYKNHEFNDALSLVNHAIQQDSKVSGYHYQKGLILLALNQKAEAAASLETSISLNPQFAEAHYNLGLIQKEQHRFEESMKSFKKSLKYDPTNADTYYNIGNVLRQRKNIEESIEYYKQAISLRTEFPNALNNLGLSLRELGNLDEAITKYTLAQKYAPDFAEAHWNRAIAFLLKGKFKQGWKEFEWRFKRGDKNSMYPFKIPIPRWDGQNFKGKKLFIHQEQGLGDTIQFIRYLPMVKKRGGTILFEVMKGLFSLLSDFPGVDELIQMSTNRERVETCDFYIPLLSLPLLFETTIESIPDSVPYIKADPDKVISWKKRMKGDGFKIGLVWAGKPEHENDHNRSCPLEFFRNLTRIPGVNLFGLQKGEMVSEDSKQSMIMGIDNLGEGLDDFKDTAAAVENLDLVISVDTSVAHLAGAMGKNVWTLIPYSPDWRWLLNREDTPWYPTMTLFRQPNPRDWHSVFKEINTKLQQKLRITA